MRKSIYVKVINLAPGAIWWNSDSDSGNLASEFMVLTPMPYSLHVVFFFKLINVLFRERAHMSGGRGRGKEREY